MIKYTVKKIEYSRNCCRYDKYFRCEDVYIDKNVENQLNRQIMMTLLEQKKFDNAKKSVALSHSVACRSLLTILRLYSYQNLKQV